MQIIKGNETPDERIAKNKKLFPQSYGLALGTHGSSYLKRNL
jgi:hypothetical protein